MDVRCSNQSKFEGGFAVCAGTALREMEEKIWRKPEDTTGKKSRMKGLNFKKSVKKEILVPLSQLASKF